MGYSHQTLYRIDSLRDLERSGGTAYSRELHLTGRVERGTLSLSRAIRSVENIFEQV
jgi:hypothetical protein